MSSLNVQLCKKLECLWISGNKKDSEILGELDTGGAGKRDEPGESFVPHHILTVDRRYFNVCIFTAPSCTVVCRFLSAENEMRRIFGSRVVREHTYVFVCVCFSVTLFST